MIKSTDRKRRAYSDSERTAGIRRWIERYPSATDATLCERLGRLSDHGEASQGHARTRG